MRTARVRVLIGLAALLAATNGCARDTRMRGVEARPDSTMFSPLDLPTPNQVRAGSGAPGPEYWQQQVDYVIEASLDDETNVVTAREVMTYTNNSPDPLDYIWLHVEQNIFRCDSIGSHIGQSTSIGMNDSFTNGCAIESVTSGGAALPHVVHDTLARVDLPVTLAPNGGVFEMEIAWTFTMPADTFRRFGIADVEQGKIFEVAQWFPAAVVYDDVYGWNTMPYLGTGEFYTNFGRYDVKLTVPRSHIVAATGVLQNPADVFTAEQRDRIEAARTSAETVMIRDADEVGDAASRPAGDGPLTWHYVADDVRTFAWASSEAFIYDACGLDGVLVQSVYPKEKLDLWDDSTQMLRTAIEGYNESWFRYPYPEATNVYGAEGGMEYPMIIFCRGSSERGLYGVTTHEIGHNWFPMLVNTDERRHAWMDEGFNTFINYYSFDRWFPGEFGRRGSAEGFVSKMVDLDRPPVVTFPDHLPRGMLRDLAYHKTAVGLVLLREEILGPERFDHAFRTYIERWAFKSPQPADFFRTMEDAAGADLAWFWRGWFLETTNLDQKVRRVRQVENEDAGTWSIAVTVDNLAAMVMPVVLDVYYADGSHEQRRLPVEMFFTHDRCKTTWTSDKRMIGVTIDVDRKFPDVDRNNNSWWQPPSIKDDTCLIRG